MLDSNQIGRYLNALRDNRGLERKAASDAAIPFNLIVQEREHSEEFRQQENDIRACIAEDIRGEVIRRGMDGIDQNVYHKGEVIATEKKYSDSLLLALARAADPMFLDRKAIVGSDGGAVKVVIQDFSMLSDKPDGEDLY